MSPIQQMLLGVGAVATKTFVDDVFSTYIYNANQNNYINVNNGIDLAGEGGLVWGKRRDYTEDHVLCDTERGPLKYLSTASTSAPTTSHGFSAYNSNGFTVNNASRGAVNQSNGVYCTWTFRKAPGFFDVVTYTGNSTAYRAIDHQLGCVPGMLIVKRTDTTGDWQVLHRKHYGTTSNYSSLKLNSTAAEYDSWSEFNRTNPTATQFTVSNDPSVNATGGTYVCYLFAGGESTAATARSVDFDGSDDYLSLPNHSDLDLGTSDFTFETWIYPKEMGSSQNYWIYGSNDDGFQVYINNNKVIIYGHDGTGAAGSIFLNSIESPALVFLNQWSHIAVTRNSNVFRLFLNGIKFHESTTTKGFETPGSTNPTIGRYSPSAQYWFKGEISNLRVVKGTAVYTSSFKPPTEPLTNITNTKLLCCNNSSTTGSTVTPGTITANGNPTASSDSPFDDPAGFVFGDSGDQNVIKCGSYVGNADADGPEIYLGWEPQWLLFKNTASSTAYWELLDNMRGLASGGNGYFLAPNASDSESFRIPLIDLTPTGFKIRNSNQNINGNNQNIIYIAIRRPDGYVGKPPELGTGVFAMDTGNAAGTITPAFDSGFPVDFGLYRVVATTSDWLSGSRLTGKNYIKTNANDAETTTGDMIWDVNTGWQSWSAGTGVQAWMWKRHAGFDVVTYEGDGTTGRQIPHSMNKTVEMMWVKQRDGTGSWQIYHKGLNGGTNPGQYFLKFDTGGEVQNSSPWNNTSPTSTTFTLGFGGSINGNNDNYIAMLFASVDGISKVGYYTGNGNSSGPTVTLGFAPRFILIKSTSNNTNWYLFDTLRGLSSGDDKRISPNENAAQDTGEFITPSSTGFQPATTWDQLNGNNEIYIYYAHA